MLLKSQRMEWVGGSMNGDTSRRQQEKREKWSHLRPRERKDAHAERERGRQKEDRNIEGRNALDAQGREQGTKVFKVVLVNEYCADRA